MSTRKTRTNDTGRNNGRRQALLLCTLALPVLIAMYALVLGLGRCRLALSLDTPICPEATAFPCPGRTSS